MTSRQIFSESEKICLQELIVKYNLHKSATLTGSQHAKKIAWFRLTEEYNSIESNCKRSEAQLKKCWDNLKTRQKSILYEEKRQRMRTGGGTLNDPQPGSSNEILIAEALTDQTDVELSGVIDSDTIYTSDDIVMDDIPFEIIEKAQKVDEACTASEIPAVDREYVDTPTRPGFHRTDYGSALSQGPRNVRMRVIQDEFHLRQEGYMKTQKKEEELHDLKKKERQWMMMAAEEIYLKAKAERKAAEEIYLCNRAKRELAEFELKQKCPK